MRRISTMALCLTAALAIFAVAASGASAKSILIAKTAKGPVKAGQELQAFSSNLVFATSGGNLECTSNTLKGVVETNEAPKDKGKITQESSTGEESFGSEHNLCRTTTVLGPVKIKANGFPWPTEFTTKGTNKVKGTKKVAFEGDFVETGVNCNYEAGKVASTFKIGGPAELVTKNQLFKLNKKTSNPLCPTEGRLSGSFSVTSAGEVVESELGTA